MPRPIHADPGTEGLSTYTLSAHEEWTLLAVTFTIDGTGSGGGDNFAWLDMRDPAGGIIYLQPLAPGDGGVMFYSLAVGASEWEAEQTQSTYFPQDSGLLSNNYVSQRLSKQTLYTGCTLNVYKTFGAESPPTDPITAVNPGNLIQNVHLWVEDTADALAAKLDTGKIIAGPYMLVGGPKA